MCEAERRHAGGLRTGAGGAIVFRLEMSVMEHEAVGAVLGYGT